MSLVSKEENSKFNKKNWSIQTANKSIKTKLINKEGKCRMYSSFSSFVNTNKNVESWKNLFLSNQAFKYDLSIF